MTGKKTLKEVQEKLLTFRERRYKWQEISHLKPWRPEVYGIKLSKPLNNCLL